MHPIFERLKERKIVQWALAYLAGAVALYSALDAFAEPSGVGDFQLRIAQVSTTSEAPVSSERIQFTPPEEGIVTAYLRDFYDVARDGERFLMVRSVEWTQETVIIEGFASRLPQLVSHE